LERGDVRLYQAVGSGGGKSLSTKLWRTEELRREATVSTYYGKWLGWEPLYHEDEGSCGLGFSFLPPY
jgi:hypothetical protein